MPNYQKLKIAIVVPYDLSCYGGVQDHSLVLAKELKKIGHEVSIIALCSNEQMKQFFSSLNINMRFLKGKTTKLAIGGKAKTISPLSFSLSYFSQFKQIFTTETFDIVHLQEPLMPLITLAALRHSRSINVGTFHSYSEDGSWYYAYFKKILNVAMKKLHTCIAVSSAAKKHIERYFPRAYHIIPNGVDLTRFKQLKKISQFDDNELNILFVGRLESRKGFQYLLSAYQILKKNNATLRLIVVGDGPDKMKHVDFINKNKIANVHFVGEISYKLLPSYYYTADIICCPAIGNESFGIILLEAMAAGKPIVASEIEGYKNVISEKESILVEPKNSNALAKALLILIQNPLLRKSMGKNGILRAKQFSWSQIVKSINEKYIAAINNSIPLTNDF